MAFFRPFILSSLALLSSHLATFPVAAEDTLQSFLDSHQYTTNGILLYEQIFGQDFVSTGGLATTQELAGLLDLKPGERVLDVGSGTGGSAFYMARQFGAFVEGVDLSRNMVEQARRRADEQQLPVTFSLIDVMAADYPPASFDVIYSRDTLLHIANKAELFQKFRQWLKPGGRLLISDYNVGDKPFTEEFKVYLTDRQYQLITVSQYRQLIEDAGFENVQAENRTGQFIDALTRELEQFEKNQKQFLTSFSKQDYQSIAKGWKAKLKRCTEGIHQWGLYRATNP